MRFSSLGLTDPDMSEKLLALGVPAFTASLNGVIAQDEIPLKEQAKTILLEINNSADKDKRPVWTLEDLLHVCRKSFKKEEYQVIIDEYPCGDYTDVGFRIMHEFVSEEDIADDMDFDESYLEALVRFIEINREWFDFDKLEERDFWCLTQSTEKEEEEEK